MEENKCASGEFRDDVLIHQFPHARKKESQHFFSEEQRELARVSGRNAAVLRYRKIPTLSFFSRVEANDAGCKNP